MKLWKITLLHPRVPTGATVFLLPRADEPTEAEAVAALQLRPDPAQGDSIRVEYSGYQVAPFYTDLLAAARRVLETLHGQDIIAAENALAKLDKATQDAAKLRPRSLIVVAGGTVTDVFSTERTMDVALVSTDDLHALGPTLQTVDEAVDAGTAGLYRIV